MESLARLTVALADRYRVEREVGAGGMATVYLARDLRHDRDVAIKVLREDLSALLGAERFLQEIRITARLDHPRILTLIDSGASDGVLWYAVPFVRGESLRARLERETQLSLEDTIAIATQIAAALDHAHRQGVIHRDVKPDNILLLGQEAMLADFGIALAMEEAGGARLTSSGFTLGTPQYASPEQATGERRLDARSDIYSLGAVVYEMLAGEAPHTGPTMQAVLSRILTEKPVPLRQRRDTLPEAVDQAVARALERIPADRHASAGDFTAALAAGASGPTRLAGAPAPGRARLVAGAATLLVAVSAIALFARGVRRGAAPGLSSLARRQLTFTGQAGSPVLSSDGGMVAYVERVCEPDRPRCRDHLMVRNARGGGRAVSVDSAPFIMVREWNPEGSTILYAARDSGGAQVNYLVPQLGGPVRRVSRGVAATFSPNGDTIAVADGGKDSVTVRFILVASLAPIDSFAVAMALSGVSNLAWSPDGRWIALLANRGSAAKLVAVVTRRGLLADSVPAPGRSVLRWTPQGDALFLQLNGSGLDDHVFRLGVNRRTGRFTGPGDTLFDLPTGRGSFDLSRNGRALAFGGMTQSTEFKAVELDGPRVSVRSLAAFTGWSGGGFALSPDGRQVAFTRGDDIGSNIYLIPFDGGSATPLTSSQEGFSQPVWLRDGRLVIVRQRPRRELAVSDLTGGPLRRFGPAGYTSADPWFLQWDADSGYVLDQTAPHRVLFVDRNGETRDSLILPDTLNQMLTVTPDGREIWFFPRGPVTEARTFYSVDRTTRRVKVAYSGTGPGSHGLGLGWAGGAFYSTGHPEAPHHGGAPSGAPNPMRSRPWCRSCPPNAAAGWTFPWRRTRGASSAASPPTAPTSG